jgi:hypothetical protein
MTRWWASWILLLAATSGADEARLRISVTSTPPGALVTTPAGDQQRTPGVLMVLPGTDLRFELPGHRTKVVRDVRADVAVALERYPDRPVWLAACSAALQRASGTTWMATWREDVGEAYIRGPNDLAVAVTRGVGHVGVWRKSRQRLALDLCDSVVGCPAERVDDCAKFCNAEVRTERWTRELSVMRVTLSGAEGQAVRLRAALDTCLPE